MQSFLLSTASQNEIAAFDNKVNLIILCVTVCFFDSYVFLFIGFKYIQENYFIQEVSAFGLV